MSRRLSNNIQTSSNGLSIHKTFIAHLLPQKNYRFPTVNRLKTYLRNSSGHIHLNGLATLALLNFHDVNVNISNVIDKLVRISKLKINIYL